MALLPLIDAAVYLGLRVETVEYLTKHCPKRGEMRKLKSVRTEYGPMFDEGELSSYAQYLTEPWPMPSKGTRMTRAFSAVVSRGASGGHMRQTGRFIDIGYLCPDHIGLYQIAL
jgi:hypothetical protein